MEIKIFISSILYLILFQEAGGRKHRKRTEIRIINQADANVKVHCQSIQLDQKDKFLGPNESMHYKFHDIDRGEIKQKSHLGQNDSGNLHHWCDAYGLFDFFETFDIYGNEAPTKRNQTWLLKSDGLYLEDTNEKYFGWFWNYPPFETYAVD
ncbi:hypothetical protein WR25_21276 isoform F [Diploscapter pachys]|uniref:S-protein homolog n=2 Tax=Diploscapter pachys TaxID=2018661 RepID=A0A2A2JDN9_9BILA|nr:hypothetical protein WR25_21276 isoform B [Diploscapter pachys]PAV59699.1 hypothetical protein WR25_21276 isoform F [Diploscapter pachys]